jgi:hypothetical protein
LFFRLILISCFLIFTNCASNELIYPPKNIIENKKTKISKKSDNKYEKTINLLYQNNFEIKKTQISILKKIIKTRHPLKKIILLESAFKFVKNKDKDFLLSYELEIIDIEYSLKYFLEYHNVDIEYIIKQNNFLNISHISKLIEIIKISNDNYEFKELISIKIINLLKNYLILDQDIKKFRNKLKDESKENKNLIEIEYIIKKSDELYNEGNIEKSVNLLEKVNEENYLYEIISNKIRIYSNKIVVKLRKKAAEKLISASKYSGKIKENLLKDALFILTNALKYKKSDYIKTIKKDINNIKKKFNITN